MNKLIIFNEPVQSVRKSQQTIHSLNCNDPITAVLESKNSLIQMIRLERVFFSEVNSQVKNREISWARATDACEKYVTNVEF